MPFPLPLHVTEGSAVLAIMHGNSFTPNDLDFYIPSGRWFLFKWFLLAHWDLYLIEDLRSIGKKRYSTCYPLPGINAILYFHNRKTNTIMNVIVTNTRLLFYQIIPVYPLKATLPLLLGLLQLSRALLTTALFQKERGFNEAGEVHWEKLIKLMQKLKEVNKEWKESNDKCLEAEETFSEANQCTEHVQLTLKSQRLLPNIKSWLSDFEEGGCMLKKYCLNLQEAIPKGWLTIIWQPLKPWNPPQATAFPVMPKVPLFLTLKMGNQAEYQALPALIHNHNLYKQELHITPLQSWGSIPAQPPLVKKSETAGSTAVNMDPMPKPVLNLYRFDEASPKHVKKLEPSPKPSYPIQSPERG
ncbi:hypothetical protein BKA70DRAFT_1218203 [Coprinopsis sp. MPI-PUGE-AT-0042]|nr:hypothetical protein BKA70DRAFT_1218203 [Coprinopsis sp. MPI-PUGE-AT-0042]